MPITSVVLNVANIDRSVNFYRRHLHAELVESDDAHAVLDLVTTALELRLLDEGRPSTWKDDDATLGYRHLGIKVGDLDAIVASLDAEGVPFRSRPLDIPDLGVRNAFFWDPDGTVIEMVENHLRYHVVVDEAGVAAERTLPPPARPRFDHVGHTVEHLDTALERYAAAGFTNIGRVEWPSMHLEFLRDGETIIELFKIPRSPVANPPVSDSYGYAGITVSRLPEGTSMVAELNDGRRLLRDPDDLAIID